MLRCPSKQGCLNHIPENLTRQQGASTLVPEDTKLEAETRQEIDAKLHAAGWAVQDKKRINLMEKLGVVVREMVTDTGPADYMLFVDGAACGIIEAKRELAGRYFFDWG